jgi:hypothetical protein
MTSLAVFVNGALLATVIFAVLLIAWGYGWSLCRMAAMSAMSDRRVDRMRDAFSPRDKGAGGHLPAPARVREVVTGDERPLLKLIDSERNRP